MRMVRGIRAMEGGATCSTRAWKASSEGGPVAAALAAEKSCCEQCSRSLAPMLHAEPARKFCANLIRKPGKDEKIRDHVLTEWKINFFRS